ncbi:MAG: hypothetical protein SangKO_059600 [Sandaracinaceae bacterium]
MIPVRFANDDMTKSVPIGVSLPRVEADHLRSHPLARAADLEVTGAGLLERPQRSDREVEVQPFEDGGEAREPLVSSARVVRRRIAFK